MSKVAITGNAAGTGVFTVASPNSNVDRVLTLPDETGTVVSTGSVAVVTETMLAAAVVPLGVDQTWQNMTGSRVLGTTYTNSTGKPIYVMITAATGSTRVNLMVNGTQFGIPDVSSAGNANEQISFVVPNNQTYALTANAGTMTFVYWSELR